MGKTASPPPEPKCLPASEYFAAHGLSHSGMKDLLVSPLRFWFRHINPNRPPDEPSAEQIFGQALHCAVLEPEEFLKRYACEIAAEDFPGCLVNMDELRTWLRDKGCTPKGTRKADLIAQVQAADPNQPILDVLTQRHFAEHQGKTMLRKEDWQRVYRAAASLREEPRMQELLKVGTPEASYFVTDPRSGVNLKARMDWVIPDGPVLDVKTFSQKMARTIDRAVADAIFYEGYYRQAFTYNYIRAVHRREDNPGFKGEHILAFVESEEPHEVRLRVLRPKFAGNPNLYWTRAAMEVRQCIELYVEYSTKFGEQPWRYGRDIDPLVDEEMRQLAYE